MNLWMAYACNIKYRWNQSIDLQSKSIDWFLYEGNTGTEWVKSSRKYLKLPKNFIVYMTLLEKSNLSKTNGTVIKV